MEVRQTARQPHLLQSESEVAAAAAASRGSRWFQMIPRNYVLHLHSLGRDGWVWLWVKNGRFFLFLCQPWLHDVGRSICVDLWEMYVWLSTCLELVYTTEAESITEA
jgi:hypothetical protein